MTCYALVAWFAHWCPCVGCGRAAPTGCGLCAIMTSRAATPRVNSNSCSRAPAPLAPAEGTQSRVLFRVCTTSHPMYMYAGGVALHVRTACGNQRNRDLSHRLILNVRSILSAICGGDTNHTRNESTVTHINLLVTRKTPRIRGTRHGPQACASYCMFASKSKIYQSSYGCWCDRDASRSS